MIGKGKLLQHNCSNHHRYKPIYFKYLSTQICKIRITVQQNFLQETVMAYCFVRVVVRRHGFKNMDDIMLRHTELEQQKQKDKTCGDVFIKGHIPCQSICYLMLLNNTY